VYPSIAVARALESLMAARAEPLNMLYIGIHGRVDERIVPQEGIAFRAVSAGQLRVASPLTFARNAAKLALGVVQAAWTLLRYRPDAVFATGGYASVPVGVAARALRKPFVVYLPDVMGSPPAFAPRDARGDDVRARAGASSTIKDDRGWLSRARRFLDARP
jgi:UDP-N-acetylglucosamine:LPS N-acetylglucosamine transferase